MFLGTYEHSLDDKNRVVLPLGLRKGLEEGDLQKKFVLAAGTRNQYLSLFSMEQWTRFLKTLKDGYDPTDEEFDEYYTDLLSSAAVVELDKQYRFAIPDASRELAGIGKDVVLVGREERVQIYAKDRWEERMRSRPERMKPPTGAKRGRPAIPVEIVGEQH